MTSKRRSKVSKTSKANISQTSLTNPPSNDLQYTMHLAKQAYEEREQACSYLDYLALITLAAFTEHEIKHIQTEKYKTNMQIEVELLKRWNKLPLEDRNKYENEAVDNDVFHQIAYTRLENADTFEDKIPSAHRPSIRKELETQWNALPDAEKIVHKRVVTNRDIETKRLF